MHEKVEKIRITVRHVRAGRALLDWTVAQLAEKAGLSVDTLTKWENRRSQPRETTRDAIYKALTEAGIVFSNGDEPGVKLILKPSQHIERQT